MRNVSLRNYNHYTKIPTTKYERRFGHVHYKSLVAVVRIIRDNGGHVNWTEVSEMTGISRFTLGRHFHSDPRNELRIAYDEMLKNVDAWLDRHGKYCSREDKGFNELMIQALFGIMDQGDEFFSVICEDSRHEGIIYRVAEKLFLHLNFNWLQRGFSDPDAKSDRGRTCIRMLQEVILKWGQTTGCDKSKTAPYTARMLAIIDAAEKNELP